MTTSWSSSREPHRGGLNEDFADLTTPWSFSRKPTTSGVGPSQTRVCRHMRRAICGLCMPNHLHLEGPPHFGQMRHGPLCACPRGALHSASRNEHKNEHEPEPSRARAERIGARARPVGRILSSARARARSSTKIWARLVLAALNPGSCSARARAGRARARALGP